MVRVVGVVGYAVRWVGGAVGGFGGVVVWSRSAGSSRSADGGRGAWCGRRRVVGGWWRLGRVGAATWWVTWRAFFFFFFFFFVCVCVCVCCVCVCVCVCGWGVCVGGGGGGGE